MGRQRRSRAIGDGAEVQRPFEGMRILDLGVIVAGGELGRLFADLGAEVIKVESAAYPDGLRQTPPGMTMSRSWALTHRNEYSLGLDLRHPVGRELFRRLVADADAVFANFKPGTLDSLGFSYERLREINPAHRAGREQRVRGDRPVERPDGLRPAGARDDRRHLAVDLRGRRRRKEASSMTRPPSFPTTSPPDSPRSRRWRRSIAREHTGTGAHVHISQAEAAVNQLATAYVAEAARAAGLPVAEDNGVHGVYPCAGDDEWCVISLRSDADRVALAQVMGRRRTPSARAPFIAAVSEWTRDTGQGRHRRAYCSGPAFPPAPMNRAVDVPADPQVAFRKVFSDMAHPLFDAPMPSETGPAPYTRIPAAELRPAPMPGEHTRQICQEVLGLSADETERLIADGVFSLNKGAP